METSSSQHAYQLGHIELNTIDINEQYERRAWSRSLGISEDRLVEIVKVMGPSADRIRAYLRTHSNA